MRVEAADLVEGQHYGSPRSGRTIHWIGGERIHYSIRGALTFAPLYTTRAEFTAWIAQHA